MDLLWYLLAEIEQTVSTRRRMVYSTDLIL